MQRFRCGLVFQAHRLFCHSTLGLEVIKKKKKFHNALRALCPSWGYPSLVLEAIAS